MKDESEELRNVLRVIVSRCVSGAVLAGSEASARQPTDAVKGYKSVVFRPQSATSASSLLTHTVKHPTTTTSQQTSSSALSSDSLATDPTANGMHCCPPVTLLSSKLLI